MKIRTFTTLGELFGHYCSPDGGSPTQRVQDLILLCLCPSYHLVVASSLFLEVGCLFCGLQYIPVDGCSMVSYDFGALMGGGECMSFYSTILNWKPVVSFFICFLIKRKIKQTLTGCLRLCSACLRILYKMYTMQYSGQWWQCSF